MSEIDLDALAAICGGMNLEGSRQSTNVQDVRGMTEREKERVQPTYVELPELRRTPNDLAHQAGLDSWIALEEQMRRDRMMRPKARG